VRPNGNPSFSSGSPCGFGVSKSEIRRDEVSKSEIRRDEQCSVCRRLTLHHVTQNRSGGGKRSSEILTCEEHRKHPNGQLDIRDPRTGEWITVRPPNDKRSA
jgi:hypothetical protein